MSEEPFHSGLFPCGVSTKQNLRHLSCVFFQKPFGPHHANIFLFKLGYGSIWLSPRRQQSHEDVWVWPGSKHLSLASPHPSALLIYILSAP